MPPPLLELGEMLAEPFDEHRAIAQSGQRIAEAGAADALLRNRAFGDVGQRSGDARRPQIGAALGDATAQKPSVGAVLVAKAMLELDVTRSARPDARPALP